MGELPEAKKSTVLSRLRLAQALLEESDKLPGREGYDWQSRSRVYHPRHEREALVIYLLLTCFDLLGQERKFLDFDGWLRKKTNEERERAIKAMQPGLSVQDQLNKTARRIYASARCDEIVLSRR